MQKTKMLSRLILLWSVLCLSGCVKFANEYAPSRARHADTGPDPKGLQAQLDMKDGASLAHFAWGIDLAAFDGEKRKAEAKAALRFRVEPPQPMTFRAEFVSAIEQTVEVRVNGRKVGQVAGVGSHKVEAAVEAADFVSGTATLVEFQSEQGIAILRAGFVPR